MTEVYLAARFSRKEEMQQVAIDLAEYGITNIASWVTGDHDYTGVPDEEIPIEDQARFAWEDLRQIEEAEVFILFTDHPGQGGSRGGKHVELGYAINKGVWGRDPIIIIGPVENIFVAYAINRGAAHFETYEAFLESLVATNRTARAYEGLPRAMRDLATGNF